MRKIRVLIVDDSTVVRRILSDVLAGDPCIEVAGTAANGKLAIAKLPQLNPDVVTLDMEMPDMDGLATLRELRKTHPRLPVIMFSTLTERGAVATLDALALGANDYVTKPANVGSVVAGMQAVRDSLVPKIKGLCPWFAPSQAPAAPAARPRVSAPPSEKRNQRPIEIVVIGSSTGGPNALGEVLPRLPADFPVPIIVVQHMPPVFTRHLATRLDQTCALQVQEAFAGAVVKPGQLWIAPGDFHVVLSKSKGPASNLTIGLHQGPPENSCRPAVDVLFRSAVEVFGGGTLGIVLTGMGCDGLRGCEVIRGAGGRVVAQDEQSSVVWGMPGVVANAGLADSIRPLSQIASQIMAEVQESRSLLTAKVC